MRNDRGSDPVESVSAWGPLREPIFRALWITSVARSDLPAALSRSAAADSRLRIKECYVDR